MVSESKGMAIIAQPLPIANVVIYQVFELRLVGALL